MAGPHDDDICPLDQSSAKTTRFQEDDIAPDQVQVADSGTHSYVTTASTNPHSQSASRTESTSSHGPFADSQAQSSTASEPDASSVHRRPSVWITIPTAA